MADPMRDRSSETDAHLQGYGAAIADFRRHGVGARMIRAVLEEAELCEGDFETAGVEAADLEVIGEAIRARGE